MIMAGVLVASNAVADGHMFCTFPQGTVMIFQFGSTEFNAATGGHEVAASFQDGSFWWVQPAAEGDIAAYYYAQLDPVRGIARNVFPGVRKAVGTCDESMMEPYRSLY